MNVGIADHLHHGHDSVSEQTASRYLVERKIKTKNEFKIVHIEVTMVWWLFDLWFIFAFSFTRASVKLPPVSFLPCLLLVES